MRSNHDILNSSNLNADVQCLKDCQSYYGQNKWLAGHRNGETGLNNPNTQDINSKWRYLLGLQDVRLTLG
jgi:hypothetical protein